MNTSVRFKNLESSDALKSYVSEKLDRMDKYFNGPAEANVVLSIEKFRHSAEIHIIGDRLAINGKEETEEMYSAIDMVLDKLEVQIKKINRKAGTIGPREKPFPNRWKKPSWKKPSMTVPPHPVCGSTILNTNPWMSMKPSCKWI